MAVKSKKYRPDELLVCCESFVSSALPRGPFSVAAGARFRADHPICAVAPWAFVPAESSTDEIARKRQEIYAAAEAANPPPPVAVPPPPPQARDCVLRKDGEGRWIPADDPRVKEEPGAYVPVNPKGLQPEEALVARQMVSHFTDELEQVVDCYAGQWVSRTNPIVAQHPSIWGLPTIDGREA